MLRVEKACARRLTALSFGFSKPKRHKDFNKVWD